MNTLLLVDGNAVIHRAFHALPDFKTSAGIPTNAVYGFATMIHKAIQDISPTHVIICFDTAAPTFRDKLYVEYRTQRPETKKELISQFPLVREFLTSAGITHIEKDGLEADDLIGIISETVKKKEFRTIILTGDKDLMQLIDKNTVILTPQIGYSNGKLYNEQEVKKKLGVKPSQVADWKSLAGDQSDNYKGVPGVGPKTAANLILQFDTVENLYKNIDSVKNEKLRETLLQHKESALMSKQLATIVRHDHVAISIDDCAFHTYNENVRDFFEKMEFRSLGNRFLPTAKKTEGKKPKTVEKKDQLGLF